MVWDQINAGDLWGKIRNGLNGPDGIGPKGDQSLQPDQSFETNEWIAGIETEPALIAPADLDAVQSGLTMAGAWVQFARPSGSVIVGQSHNVASVNFTSNVFYVNFSLPMPRADYVCLGSFDGGEGTGTGNRGAMHITQVSLTQAAIFLTRSGSATLDDPVYVSAVFI